MLLERGALTVMTGAVVSTATGDIAEAEAQMDDSARQTVKTEHLQQVAIFCWMTMWALADCNGGNSLTTGFMLHTSSSASDDQQPVQDLVLWNIEFQMGCVPQLFITRYWYTVSTLVTQVNLYFTCPTPMVS